MNQFFSVASFRPEDCSSAVFIVVLNRIIDGVRHSEIASPEFRTNAEAIAEKIRLSGGANANAA